MSKDFFTAVKDRRTIYGITNDSLISDERILAIVKDSVKYAPTAFNSQSGRVVVLFGEHHNKLWDIVIETLRKIVSPDNFSSTENKINGFRKGYGSVLFFEDQSIIEELQRQFQAYSDNFPIWSQQSSGMLQYIIWTGLESEGLGASLQHYNPLIDEEVKKQWHIPESWKLIAQMPFGHVTAPAGDKKFGSLEEMVKVFK